MNRKAKGSLVKKLTAGILAVSMLLGGAIIAPKEAEATGTEVIPTTIDYDSTNYDIKDYWNEKKAPVKEGYVFGGWYKGTGVDDFMTAEEAQTAVEGTFDGTVYAKFVPASVLSVKTQNESDAETEGVTDVRVISSLDCKNYEKVGFDIYLANKNKVYKYGTTNGACETTSIYKGLMESGEPKEANAIFGGVSQFVSVWLLEGVKQTHWDKIIYVRPYWVTMDGTTVEGLGKYVHVEDQANGYINIPVNLGTGQAVAAGIVNMTYDKDLEFIGFEAGRLLPDMKYIHDAENKTIKMIGSVNTENLETDANPDVSADGIFANIRVKPSDTTVFDMTTEQFCNWAEEKYGEDESGENVVKAWDVKYEN